MAAILPSSLPSSFVQRALPYSLGLKSPTFRLSQGQHMATKSNPNGVMISPNLQVKLLSSMCDRQNGRSPIV